MPELVDPIKVYNIARLGFKRMEYFCKIRAMMFKSYIGQYGREEKGIEGEEPINLVFNNIRAYVPNLVMQNPITNVMLSKGVYVYILCLYMICICILYILPETSIRLPDYLPLYHTHTRMPL